MTPSNTRIHVENITKSFATAIQRALDRRAMRMKRRWEANGRYVTPKTAIAKRQTEIAVKTGTSAEVKEGSVSIVPRWRRNWGADRRRYHSERAYKRPAHKMAKHARFVFNL